MDVNFYEDVMCSLGAVFRNECFYMFWFTEAKVTESFF